MTNLTLLVTIWVNLVTNPVPAGTNMTGQNFYQVTSVSTLTQYLPDGALMNCSAVNHFGYVTNAPSGMLRSIATPPVPRGRIRTSQFLGPAILQHDADFAGGGPDDAENLCVMFKTNFLTQSNFIYRLEWSPDLRNWLACQPEIDGTGEEDYFFDVNEGCRSYRITSRPGPLP